MRWPSHLPTAVNDLDPLLAPPEEQGRPPPFVMLSHDNDGVTKSVSIRSRRPPPGWDLSVPPSSQCTEPAPAASPEQDARIATAFQQREGLRWQV